MNFKMTFAMDNAAFGEPGDYPMMRAEIEKVFASALMQLPFGERGGLRDSNGNRIGEWAIEGSEG